MPDDKNWHLTYESGMVITVSFNLKSKVYSETKFMVILKKTMKPLENGVRSKH